MAQVTKFPANAAYIGSTQIFDASGNLKAPIAATATSMVYASVDDADADEFDDNGYALYLAGLTAGAGHVFQASAVASVASTHALRINIGGTAYFIPLHTSASFA